MNTQAPPTRYARTPRGDIAFKTLGDGPLDVVLVNPMSRCIEALWDYPGHAELLDKLAAFGRLTVFDRRGCGTSDPLPADLPPTWEDWQEDLLTVLDEVGVERAVVVAERDAAAATLLFASSHPERVRALVLCNTSARYRVAPGYPIGESYDRAEQLCQQWVTSWATERMVAMTRPTLAGDPDYVRWVMRMQRMSYTPRRAGAEFRYVLNFDARAVLPAITAPTLVLHRREFLVVPAAQGQYLAANIAGARFETLPGSDLDVLVPGDAEAIALIEAFLAAERPARGEQRALATVLQIEVAGSQQAAANVGEVRWREILTQVGATLGELAAPLQGRVVEQRGERFMLAFEGPNRALRFAAGLRRSLRDRYRLEVSAGVHIGECSRRDDILVGAAVDVSAGVLNAAQPGEVLATGAVVELAAGSGLELRRIGVQPLANVAGRWELYTLEA